MYIRAAAAISPQVSLQQIDAARNAPVGNRFYCAEPDYSTVVDAKMIRRMSRIIKMGVAAAKNCLQLAQLEMPDAIITGTAYGCLADTEMFLSRMIEFKETLLTPTSFIQSTHNTVGAQIALLLKCHNYNNTFVHRGFSFESSLLDAMTLIEEKSANAVLVGAVDEIIDSSHNILKRFRLFKNDVPEGTQLYNSPTRGSLNGEGAAFFVLSKEATGADYAQLQGLQTIYKPQKAEDLSAQIRDFLSAHQCDISDIDLLVCGDNGDVKTDAIYQQVRDIVFPSTAVGRFKHLCGDYPTATGFALWLAAEMIHQRNIPAQVGQGIAKNPGKILIYNHYQNIHHSLYLVSAC